MGCGFFKCRDGSQRAAIDQVFCRARCAAGGVIRVAHTHDAPGAPLSFQQKLDLLSERENATSTPTRRKFASDVLASPPRMTPAKKLRLLNDEEEEESRVASEVENILSGKVLDTDISGIPEIEELMSTESKILSPDESFIIVFI